MKKMRNTKTYSELIKLKTFQERFEYLKEDGDVGAETFGFNRYLNQRFYTSPEWKRVRDFVITRDCCCDMGLRGYDLMDDIIVHHLNPITKEDVINKNPDLLDPEYLICVSKKTHRAIHYSEQLEDYNDIIARSQYDTCPWR